MPLILMRTTRSGNVPSCSSSTLTDTVTTTTDTVVTTVMTLPDIAFQPGEHLDEQLAHGRQAGANDGDVVLDGGPDGDGVVVPGYVGGRLKGEEGVEADDGDYCVAGRMMLEMGLKYGKARGGTVTEGDGEEGREEEDLQNSNTQHQPNGQLLLPIHVEFPELG